MNRIDVQETKANWMRPRAHRLLTQGWSPAQATEQAELWWQQSIEGRLTAEIECLRGRVAELEAQTTPTAEPTYLCCRCCDELPHPDGVGDHHTIRCDTPGCSAARALTPLEEP